MSLVTIFSPFGDYNLPRRFTRNVHDRQSISANGTRELAYKNVTPRIVFETSAKDISLGKSCQVDVPALDSKTIPCHVNRPIRALIAIRIGRWLVTFREDETSNPSFAIIPRQIRH